MGRQLQKKQTGLIHYCYQSEDPSSHDTVPIYENALFALALFRSRLSDHVLEGKKIIEKILHFEKNGFFPTYLHDYPSIHNTHLILHLLPVFYWVRTDFAHVIGELKEKLEESMERMLKNAKNLSLPAWGKLRLEAFEGKAQALPQSANDWGEALISLQIAEKKGENIDSFIQNISELWDPALSLYIGPKKEAQQEEHYPKLTLLDLFICEWQKKYPARAKIQRPVHLRGVLIRPRELYFEEKPIPCVQIHPSEEWPFMIAWDDHTFVLAKKGVEISGTAEELICLPSPEGDEMKVSGYLNYHPDHEILVDGGKATTFKLGETVEIRSKGLTILLTFHAEDGQYFGHILRGNRPGQISCVGKEQFASYDWRIALRAVTIGKSPLRLNIAYLFSGSGAANCLKISSQT